MPQRERININNFVLRTDYKFQMGKDKSTVQKDKQEKRQIKPKVFYQLISIIHTYFSDQAIYSPQLDTSSQNSMQSEMKIQEDEFTCETCRQHQRLENIKEKFKEEINQVLGHLKNKKIEVKDKYELYLLIQPVVQGQGKFDEEEYWYLILKLLLTYGQNEQKVAETALEVLKYSILFSLQVWCPSKQQFDEFQESIGNTSDKTKQKIKRLLKLLQNQTPKPNQVKAFGQGNTSSDEKDSINIESYFDKDKHKKIKKSVGKRNKAKQKLQKNAADVKFEPTTNKIKNTFVEHFKKWSKEISAFLSQETQLKQYLTQRKELHDMKIKIFSKQPQQQKQQLMKQNK